MFRVRPPSARAAVLALTLSLTALPAAAQEMTHARFASVMDGVFGRGAWRMTGGYRTQARENQLRAQGAMTVRPGGVSRHSLGRPGAPGAYDLVVNGMSPFEAARRLQAAGAPFARYQPKGTHGTQGPHLHLEPYGFGPRPTFQVASAPKVEAQVPGRTLSVTLITPRPSASSAAQLRQELAQLRADAAEENAEAQLELGRIHMQGYLVPRDFATAERWLAAAARNPIADAEVRAEAAEALAQVTALLALERAQQPAQVARLGGTPLADR